MTAVVHQFLNPHWLKPLSLIVASLLAACYSYVILMHSVRILLTRLNILRES